MAKLVTLRINLEPGVKCYRQLSIFYLFDRVRLAVRGSLLSKRRTKLDPVPSENVRFDSR
jgi:hypothetical protein